MVLCGRSFLLVSIYPIGPEAQYRSHSSKLGFNHYRILAARVWLSALPVLVPVVVGSKLECLPLNWVPSRPKVFSFYTMKLSFQGALLATSILLRAASPASGSTTTCNVAATSTSCSAMASCTWQTNFNTCVEKVIVVRNEALVPLPIGAITYSNPTDSTVDVTIRQNEYSVRQTRTMV